MNSLISITDDKIKSKKVIQLFGIKIKINSYRLKYEQAILDSKEELSYLEFLNEEVRENSILMIETNNCHGEVLPGIAKYFLDLGYNIDVLLSKNLFNSGIFAKIDTTKIRIFKTSTPALKIILKNKAMMSKYKYLYFNSDIIYSKNNFPINKVFNIVENKSVIQMNHRLEKIEDRNLNSKNIVLDKFDISKDFKVVNAHYFGNVDITPKNSITNFIVVGRIEPKRKNFTLIEKSIKYLLDNDIKDFKITVISKYGQIKLPKKYAKFVDFKKNLTYDEMYKEMEKADFFLTLLDPTNPEQDRYLTCGTSGSFQLIYGFKKPCLIEEKFASKYRFNNENSIVYKGNENLPKAMQQATLIKNDEYSILQNNLKIVADNLYKESLENLKEILK